MASNMKIRDIFSAPPGINCPPNTPPRPTLSSARTFSADPFLMRADNQYKALYIEMRDSFVGPMPVKRFLDEFMPVEPEFKPRSAAVKGFVRKLKDLRSSTAPERDFISAIEGSNLCSNLHFINTTTAVDSTTSVKRKPDISVQLKGDSKEDKPKTTHWKDQQLPIERKPDDPFLNAVKGLERKEQAFYKTSSGQAEEIIGQITSYSIVLREIQFRTHCFSVLWVHSKDPKTPDGMRFIRWDRAGAVVTELVDFGKQGCRIAEFFFRFNHLSASNRGHDPTISKPSAQEQLAALAALLHHSDSVATMKAEDLLRIEVTDDSDGDNSTHYYIIYKPRWTVRSPTGRGTQGFPAYDVSKKAVVYLKDTWRIDHPTFDKEGSTYSRLLEKGVPHIPTLLRAGDVPGQATRTQDYRAGKWCFRSIGMFRLQHYRLVLQEIGQNLWTFDNPKLLVKAIGHALIAHAKALDRASTLHRDISIGNILLYEGRGLLIDWDLSRRVSAKDEPSQARQQWRTGTWQFISARILQEPSKIVHERRDDLESAFHVLTYCLFRWQKTTLVTQGDRHTLDSHHLEEVMTEIYDKRTENLGEYIGGGGKISFFDGRVLGPDIVKASFGKSPALVTMLEALRDTFKYLYPLPAHTIDNKADGEGKGQGGGAGADEKTARESQEDVDFEYEEEGNVQGEIDDDEKRRKAAEAAKIAEQQTQKALQTSGHIITIFHTALLSSEWSKEPQPAFDYLPRMQTTKEAKKRHFEAAFLSSSSPAPKRLFEPEILDNSDSSRKRLRT